MQDYQPRAEATARRVVPEMSAFHRTARWMAFSRKMRAKIKPLLPLPCVECGWPVYPEQAWDVSHIVAYTNDPFQPLTPDSVGPGHRRCNSRDGGRIGRAKQASAKQDGSRLPKEGSGW